MWTVTYNQYHIPQLCDGHNGHAKSFLAAVDRTIQRQTLQEAVNDIARWNTTNPSKCWQYAITNISHEPYLQLQTL